MECPSCGAEVDEHQQFCQDCGSSLRGVTEPTQPIAVVGDPEDDPSPAEPVDAAVAISAAEPTDDPAPTEPVDEVAAVGAVDSGATATEPANGPELPRLADLPTAEITPREPLPEPSWAAPAPSSVIVTAEELHGGPPTEEVPMPAPATATTTTGPVVTSTAEMPAVFDGHADVAEYPQPREPFKLRLSLILGFFAAAVAAMIVFADLIDVRTSRPVDGIDTGVRMIDDIGSNLAAANLVGCAVAIVGGLAACFGLRWGAGLAAGAGLALAGGAALTIGLAEVPIAVAQSVARRGSGEVFTLTVTRDLGYWLIVALAGIGLVVFLVSLRQSGTGGHAGLNPWIAAVGAVSAVVVAVGPLIPVGNASFADNFSSPDTLIDLPTAYFAGRLAQLGLIALCGVVGFLLVRTWGLGLAAGGLSVATYLWVTSLLEVGDFPIGIAAGNFGAGDTVPHGVTTTGMVLTLALLAIAAIVAAFQFERVDRR